MSRFVCNKNAFSLVMVLIFVTLLSVLVMGFLISMRVEVFSAESHYQGAKARYLSEAGVDMAVARLRHATGTASNLFWMTQPGQVYSVALVSTATLSKFPDSFTSSSLVKYDLFSGAGSYSDGTDVSADLQGGKELLTPSSSMDKIRVKWIYLRKNGSMELASATLPAYSATNPVVGRFAFWVDDESTRLNVNTALTRTTSYPVCHPAQVNLAIFNLSTASLSALFLYRTGSISGGHLFNSLNELRVGSVSLGTLIDSDRFSLSTSSQTPDLNMFGEPRLVLTTQAGLAGNAPFLNILNTPNTDPGLYSNLNSASVSAVVSTLSAILARKNWPYGSYTFNGKYLDSGAATDLTQIAVNIIDYVRCRESTQNLVAPIRGYLSTTSSFVLDGTTGGILGVSRTLKITERTAYLEANPTSSNSAYLKVIYELHLPKYSNVYNLNIKNNLTVSYNIVPTPVGSIVNTLGGNAGWSGATSFPVNYLVDGSNAVASSYTMNAGDYVTITTSKIVYLYAISNSTPIRHVISDVTGLGTFATGVYNDNNLTRLDIVSAPALATLSSTLSQAVDDPWVNHGVNPTTGESDWVVGNATFGAANSNLSTLGTTPTLSGAEQDTDGSGKITDIGERLPAPAGTTTTYSDNTNGVVESVAELGYIHTGIETTDKGTPYRTLRLQPRKTANRLLLPDWVLLDMFSAPKFRWASISNKATGGTVPASLTVAEQPQAATTNSLTQKIASNGGLVNVNAVIAPAFANSSSTLTRSKPIEAVFLGSYTDVLHSTTVSTSSSTVKTSDYSSALISRTLATAVAGTGYRNTFGSLPFLSRGEIAEIANVSDRGEESEVRLYGTVDLLTTRSSMFRVYSVGQAIRQSPVSPYSITVQGERRTMRLIERAVIVNTTSGAVTVQFNTVYSGKPQ
jgi:hypothetical protein